MTSVNDGLFHHVAFIREGLTLRVYVDGSLDNSATVSVKAAINNAVPLYAGWSVCQPPGVTHWFNGALDEGPSTAGLSLLLRFKPSTMPRARASAAATFLRQ